MPKQPVKPAFQTSERKGDLRMPETTAETATAPRAVMTPTATPTTAPFSPIVDTLFPEPGRGYLALATRGRYYDYALAYFQRQAGVWKEQRNLVRGEKPQTI